MASAASIQKLRGGYYTPEPLAAFLAEWVIQRPDSTVLEPSCGDGSIIAAAASTLIRHGASASNLASQLYGVELFPAEAAKARQRLREFGAVLSDHNIRNGDFFRHCDSHLKAHDLAPYGQVDDQEEIFGNGAKISFGPALFDGIVGNPPFIRYQHIPESSRGIPFHIMRRAGMKPNRLTNAWVPFVVASTFLLKKHGRMGLIIPAELLQVSYSAELRRFLTEHFSKITLVTFKRLVFDGVQQEVVLLLGERNGDEHTGIRTVELTDLDDLRSYEVTAFSDDDLKPMNHSTEKWTQYFLDRKGNRVTAGIACQCCPHPLRSGCRCGCRRRNRSQQILHSHR